MTTKTFFPLCPAWTLYLIMGLLAAPIAFSDTLNVRDDAPEKYTVVKGDTLWDISGRYLDKPWRWPELWKNNPQIANPHLIYPGDVISLYYVDGQPTLGINRDESDVIRSEPDIDPDIDPNTNLVPETVKLLPQIKATPIDSAIPVVPVEDIQQFLHELKVVGKATLDNAPYIVRGQEGRIIAAQGDRVYAKGLDSTKSGQTFQIYHQGKPVRDPVTNNIIAYESILVGNAKLEQAGNPATLLITSSKRETSVGDRLIATTSDVELSNFYPRVPDNFVSARILNVVDGTRLIGRNQTVIINAGTRQGLDRGHVLSTFTKPEKVPDNVSSDPVDTVTLPSERSGTLIVIRPFENLSYALVMESRLPLHPLDEVRTPE